MLARLQENGTQPKGVEYLVEADGHGFTMEDYIWKARWQSSFRHVKPGFSTFLNNVPESWWKKEDILNGTTKHARTVSMFNNTELTVEQWEKTSFLAKFEHEPTGIHNFQPSLQRGRGVWAAKSCLYGKGFHRFTVKSIQALVESEKAFAVDTGVRPPYLQTWTMPKKDSADFNEQTMRQYAELWFATTIDDAQRFYPKVNGANNIGMLRTWMGSYTIVGRLPGDKLHDLHRDGIIKGITEHILYINTLLGARLGPLEGTTQRKKKAAAKPKAKVVNKTRAARSST